jgi:membrane-bound lytic murein transglycosylase A
MRIATACLLATVVLAGCQWRTAPKKDYARPLPPGKEALEEVDSDELPELTIGLADRERLRAGIARSQIYLKTATAERAYAERVGGFTRDQVQRSLTRLDAILATAQSEGELNDRIKREFRAWRSVGCDDKGTVLFTGYYTPILPASRTADAEYRFPLYKRPADLVSTATPGIAAVTINLRRRADGTTEPYPDRAALESGDMLKGTELIWLRDPFDCYLVQVQGSAKLRLNDGSLVEVGYDGTNGHPYVPIGPELVKDGKIAADRLSFSTMLSYFRAHPEDVAIYTRRNPRYVFFRTLGGGPFGSIGQKVEADITIATDKTIFPPGAASLVETRMIVPPGADPVGYAALRLDQDTGGAIRAPGRTDLYMGEGDTNATRAGAQYAEGKLYYLMLRE